MSRSFKKHGWAGDKKSNKEIANRNYRRNSDTIVKGNAYRKNFEQYDICDYGNIAPTYEEFCETEYAKKFKSEKSRHWAYQKMYFRK